MIKWGSPRKEGGNDICYPKFFFCPLTQYLRRLLGPVRQDKSKGLFIFITTKHLLFLPTPLPQNYNGWYRHCGSIHTSDFVMKFEVLI